MAFRPWKDSNRWIIICRKVVRKEIKTVYIELTIEHNDNKCEFLMSSEKKWPPIGRISNSFIKRFHSIYRMINTLLLALKRVKLIEQVFARCTRHLQDKSWEGLQGLPR